MNVPDEPIPSPNSPYAERIAAGVRRLRSDAIAARLEIRRLKPPLILAPDLTNLEASAPPDEIAGPVGRDALGSLQKAVNRFQRRARQIWRSMTLPVPETPVRLLPADQIQPLETAMNRLCQDFQQQANQPPLSRITMVTFGLRQLSGLLSGPANSSNIFCGSFGIRWDYPSLEPDSRLEPIAPQLYREEKERLSERFRRAAEEIDASLVGAVIRLTSLAVELLTDRSGNAAPPIRRLQRLAEAFLRLQRLNIARDGAVDLLLAEAHKMLKNLGAKGLPPGGLAARRIAATVRWIQSEFFAIRAASMYPADSPFAAPD